MDNRLKMPGGGNLVRNERHHRNTRSSRSSHARYYYTRSLVLQLPPKKNKIAPRTRCQSAPKVMDNSTRSSSPPGSRPLHRPPSPPNDAGFENQAYQHDDQDANHNQSFTSNGHQKEPEKTLEAVNLEMINMTPKNGKATKKDVEVDLSSTNPYDEYFVPVNEHRKYMRGEKLYVTADKRGEKGGCKRPLCWSILGLVIAAVVVLIVLAATGILFTNTPTPVEEYNGTVTSARAFGGIGQHHQTHDHSKHDTSKELQNDGQIDTKSSEEEGDSGVYVPHILEGMLTVDNVEFGPATRDQDSIQFKEFADNFAEGLSRAIFDDNLHNLYDSKVLVLKINDGSNAVVYRVHWTAKPAVQEQFDKENVLTPEILRKTLLNYLSRTNRMINMYHISEGDIMTRQVLNLCLVNKNDCENQCEFNELTLDFTCTCPKNQMLDGKKKCVSVFEDNTESKILTIDAENTSGTNIISNEGQTANTKVYPLESTTKSASDESDADLNFSHLFGNTDGQEHDNKTVSAETTFSSSEPQNVSVSMTELSNVSIADPNPQPSAEPQPEPSAEPNPETSTKSSSEMTYTGPGLEPVNDLNSKSSQEPNPEPEPEPKPELKPEPKPDSTEEPELTGLIQSSEMLIPTGGSDSNYVPTTEPEIRSTTNIITELEADSKIASLAEPTFESKTDTISSLGFTTLPTADPDPIHLHSSYIDSKPNQQQKTEIPNLHIPEKTGKSDEFQYHLNYLQGGETTTTKEETNTLVQENRSNDYETTFPDIWSSIFTNDGVSQQANIEKTHQTTTEPIRNQDQPTEPVSLGNSYFDTNKGILSILQGEKADTPELNEYSHSQLNQTLNGQENKQNSNDDLFYTMGPVILTQPNIPPKQIDIIHNSKEEKITNIPSNDPDASVSILNSKYDENKNQNQNSKPSDDITFDIISEIDRLMENSHTETNSHPMTSVLSQQSDKNGIQTYHVPEDMEQNIGVKIDNPIEMTPTIRNEKDVVLVRTNQNKTSEIQNTPNDETTQFSLTKHYNRAEPLGTKLYEILDKRVEPTNNNQQSSTESAMESIEITFDTLNMLYNRSSKSIPKNRTEIKVISDLLKESVPTTTQSDWLVESATEVTLDSKPEVKQATTESMIKIEELLRQGMTKDDFEPDYLNNMGSNSNKMTEQDEPFYGMVHDYDNDDPRVKRVNKANNGGSYEVPLTGTAPGVPVKIDEFMTSSREATGTQVKVDDTVTSSGVAIGTSEKVDGTATSSGVVSGTPVKVDEIVTSSGSSVKVDGSVTSNGEGTDNNHTTVLELSPAPVWEEVSHTTEISQTSVNLDIRKLASDDTDLKTNLNVSIYEVPISQAKDLPHKINVTSHSEHDFSHESDMNPFLPETENNQRLVEKLQQGHDFVTHENDDQSIHTNNKETANLNVNKFTSTTTSKNISSSNEHATTESNIYIKTTLEDNSDVPLTVIPTLGSKSSSSESFSSTAQTNYTVEKTTAKLQDTDPSELLTVIPTQSVPKKDMVTELSSEVQPNEKNNPSVIGLFSDVSDSFSINQETDKKSNVIPLNKTSQDSSTSEENHKEIIPTSTLTSTDESVNLEPALQYISHLSGNSEIASENIPATMKNQGSSGSLELSLAESSTPPKNLDISHEDIETTTENTEPTSIKSESASSLPGPEISIVNLDQVTEKNADNKDLKPSIDQSLETSAKIEHVVFLGTSTERISNSTSDESNLNISQPITLSTSNSSELNITLSTSNSSELNITLSTTEYPQTTTVEQLSVFNSPIEFISRSTDAPEYEVETSSQTEKPKETVTEDSDIDNEPKIIMTTETSDEILKSNDLDFHDDDQDKDYLMVVPIETNKTPVKKYLDGDVLLNDISNESKKSERVLKTEIER